MKPFWNFLVLVGLLAASACSSLPSMPPIGMPPLFGTAEKNSTPAVAAVPGAPLTARERLSRAVEMLGAGREGEAKVEIKAALESAPQDRIALLLLSQIEADPPSLLGSTYESYIVQTGDTMSAIAERFTGNSLMFYALSRYNGLAAPNALIVGRALKVPMTAKSATVAAGSSASEIRLGAVNARDTERANATRLEALQHLNTGDVNRAVALLKEAVSLDGNDPAIRRDLDRALRIQGALDGG